MPSGKLFRLCSRKQIWKYNRPKNKSPSCLLIRHKGEIYFKRNCPTYLMRSTLRLRKASRAAPFSMPFCNKAKSIN